MLCVEVTFVFAPVPAAIPNALQVCHCYIVIVILTDVGGRWLVDLPHWLQADDD